MPSSFDQLLHNLAHGQLSIDAACKQLAQIATNNAGKLSPLIARIQSEIVAGKLTHEAGRALLAVMDSANEKTAVLSSATRVPEARSAADNAELTEIHSPDQTVRKPKVDPTLIRPSVAPAPADETQLRPKPDPTIRATPPTTAAQSTPPVDATVRMPTEMRPAETGDADATVRTRRPAQSDATSMRSPSEATVAKSSATLIDPAQQPASRTEVRDDDATVHKGLVPPTAARTLKAPEASNAGQSAYAPTLKTPEKPAKTQVMGERLVQSLDEFSEAHHGPLQPGSIIKQRFVLETLIGKGGMGLVFAAIDRRKEEAKDPNPRVAFKVLNADFQRHPQSLMALQREARKAQSLAHPNVVTVFDFDRDGDAIYMTMELLKGRSLDAVVREARGKGVGREVALPIIRGIAEGLAYAHRKGIVHSDLKPGNVFILEDNTPKILDFGIARAVPSSVTEENQDVFDAGSLGAYTEAYATDEMVDGIDPHPADDLYALGIIGYELLIGFHPYQRHSAPNSRKLGLKPPPLKGLKRREAKALERCLSFDRKDRPKDASEFLKLFRGVTALQQATLAATVVLALASGYLWYENYLETSPAIPFSQLPQETQDRFTQLLQDGDAEWSFYVNEQNEAALQGAVANYVEAYALHPRNREAVKRLRRTADAYLELAGDNAEYRKEIAGRLQGASDYYRKYQPLVDAAK